MKTKELIRQLQEQDPTGEAECCINNQDIHFVEALPAYYDGALEVLTRDLAKTGYYNIIGGKFIRDQNVTKVAIHPMSIEDLYIDHGVEGWPFQLDISEMLIGGYTEGYMKEQIREWDAEIQSVKDSLIQWEKDEKEKENEKG